MVGKRIPAGIRYVQGVVEHSDKLKPVAQWRDVSQKLVVRLRWLLLAHVLPPSPIAKLALVCAGAINPCEAKQTQNVADAASVSAAAAPACTVPVAVAASSCRNRNGRRRLHQTNSVHRKSVGQSQVPPIWRRPITLARKSSHVLEQILVEADAALEPQQFFTSDQRLIGSAVGRKIARNRSK